MICVNVLVMAFVALHWLIACVLFGFFFDDMQANETDWDDWDDVLPVPSEPESSGSNPNDADASVALVPANCPDEL